MSPRELDESREKRARFETTALPFLKSAHDMALRLTRREEDARDLVQETFLRAYRTFENFRPGTNCKAWLLTILYSIFVNQYWKKKREPVAVPLEEIEERFRECLVSEGDQPLRRWSDPEVVAALDGLPEANRSVVLLVDVEELTYEEAAAALGCPVGTVRSRLFRARKQLFVTLQGPARKMGYLNEAETRR